MGVLDWNGWGVRCDRSDACYCVPGVVCGVAIGRWGFTEWFVGGVRVLRCEVGRGVK